MRTVPIPTPEERLRPFGVGVLAAGPRPDASGERLAIALVAYEAGYFLLDTIEVDHAQQGVPAAVDVDQVLGLAVRTQAEAFFVRGPWPQWLEPMAAVQRMVIRDANGPLVAVQGTAAE